MKETWRTIFNYPNYEISNNGKVRNIKSKLIKKYATTHNGYFRVQLLNYSGGKCFMVHRLVAEAFIPNPNNLPQVNHIDGNKQNNSVENLEWCTCSYNINEAFKMGLCKTSKNHYRSKKVIQYDLDGNIIKKWDCITDAIKILNLGKSANSAITVALKDNTKTAYGFKWKYIK